MCTTRTCQVNMTNSTGGNAIITLSHRYSDDKPEISIATFIPKDGTYLLLQGVHFNTGFLCTGQDYWCCVVQVLDGPNKGNYSSEGTLEDPTKICTLGSDDGGQTLAFSVSATNFVMGLYTGGCTTSMNPVTETPDPDKKILAATNA